MASQPFVLILVDALEHADGLLVTVRLTTYSGSKIAIINIVTITVEQWDIVKWGLEGSEGDNNV